MWKAVFYIYQIASELLQVPQQLPIIPWGQANSAIHDETLDSWTCQCVTNHFLQRENNFNVINAWWTLPSLLEAFNALFCLSRSFSENPDLLYMSVCLTRVKALKSQWVASCYIFQLETYWICHTRNKKEWLFHNIF